MDRVEKVCALDRLLLQKFSSECLVRLRKQLLFQFVFPVIDDFLEANVEKEVAKDRMIIEYAGRAFATGKSPGEDKIQKVYEKTLEIDSQYIENTYSRHFSFTINYGAIEGIRKQRIKLIIDHVITLLAGWGEDDSFEESVRRSFTWQHYGECVHNFLHLYSLETRELGDSIRIILPARIAKDLFVVKLFEAMEKVAEGLTRACQEKVFNI